MCIAARSKCLFTAKLTAGHNDYTMKFGYKENEHFKKQKRKRG